MLLNINMMETENALKHSFNNFQKITFTWNTVALELGVSCYSNLVFLILSSNGKLGCFYTGEIENQEEINNNSDNEYDTNIYEIKCLLGNRRDEANYVLCSNIITNLLSRVIKKNPHSKIKKIIVSTSLKFNELFDLLDVDDSSESNLIENKEFQRFLITIKDKISQILNL